MTTGRINQIANKRRTAHSLFNPPHDGEACFAEKQAGGSNLSEEVPRPGIEKLLILLNLPSLGQSLTPYSVVVSRTRNSYGNTSTCAVTYVRSTLLIQGPSNGAKMSNVQESMLLLIDLS